MEKSVTDQLKNVILKESNNFSSEKGHNLQNVLDTLSKNGIPTNSGYSLPLKDTIGKSFHEGSHFK